LSFSPLWFFSDENVFLFYIIITRAGLQEDGRNTAFYIYIYTTQEIQVKLTYLDKEAGGI
jgi:hypothetical protein